MSGANWNWIEKMSELSSKNISFSTVTVVDTGGSAPRENGAKMIVISESQFYGTIGGGNLEKQCIEAAVKCLNEKNYQKLSFPLGAKSGQCCGGVVEVFIEPVNMGPTLYLFGAGHVGQAVAETLAGTPFSITLIDSRDEWLNSKNINHHISKYSSLAEIDQSLDDKNSYFVIMTHSHDDDYEIVKTLCQRQTKYLGLIGSHSKWQRFKSRLKSENVEESHISNITCPIGIKIGGKAPKEIAISLASELIKIHYES